MTADLRRPDYEPAACTPGVVHVGVGAFHRAHQALYLDELLHDRQQKNWAVAGVNLRPESAELLSRLAARDGRYVLKTTASDGASAWREIAALRELVDHRTEPAKAEALLARPAVQLVTMTVTEAGYHLDEDEKLLVAEVEAAEAAAGAGGTAYGYLRAGLHARRAADAGPVTLLSCDNLRDNGRKLAAGLRQYLELRGDDELAKWLEENASFPCCVVDRITPAPTAELAAETEALFGIKGDATVMGEEYVQWTVEDSFAGARPPLERAGVQFAADVGPYEDAKLRVLNGGHVAVAFPAALRGIEYFDQAIVDPELSALFDRYVTGEVIPALGAAGPVDLPAYRDLIKRRFANAHIKDTVERICKHGANKMAVFVTPEAGFAVLAAWFGFLRAVEAGRIGFAYEEPMWEQLRPLL
ncbi:MAG: mannitol dehydrogenase family protein, partial [Betaproteobacteria bacterium AqS2]|nr:mannitol dehydrogenase family protein [Betaproteobacteria bacterium AqS2]